MPKGIIVKEQLWSVTLNFEGARTNSPKKVGKRRDAFHFSTIASSLLFFH